MNESPTGLAFGAQLRKVRERKPMTQEALAKLVGCKPSAISLYETGKRMPDLDRFERICKALGLPRDKFLMTAARSAIAMKKQETA